jgi:NitT/TauT family transport system substrate-binding protein
MTRTTSHRTRTWLAAGLTAAAITGLAATPASAADHLRVGISSATAFTFAPLTLGIEKGFFAKHNLDVKKYAFAGGGKEQQALVADSIDMALGSGPEMASIAKGAPQMAVAAMANEPSLLVIMARTDLPIHSAKDLKGHTVAVSTPGSLTAWLVRQTSLQQGWGHDGIKIVPLGSTTSELAALRVKKVDAMVGAINMAYDLEQKNIVRTVVKCGDIVKDFHIHVIYATNKIIKNNPDAVRNFLAGWFETIKWMNAHKDESVKIVSPIINSDEKVTAWTYDQLMPIMRTDGHFNPKALETLANSWVDLHVLKTKPDMSKLYTEKFLPGATM